MDFNIQINNNEQIKSYSPNSYSNDNQTNKKTQPPIQFNNQQKPQKQSKGCCSFLTLQYYIPFFNVSQIEVFQRIKRSFIPWKRDFFQTARQAPDLYGPFWILTTIIFLLSSTGNLARYFYNFKKDGFLFRLQLVRYGVLIVYSIGIGFPILMGLLFKFFEAQVNAIQMLCLYGYSLSCFIPILILCIAPSQVLQWILIVYGILNSSGFIILNLYGEIQSLSKPKQYISYGLIISCQIGLFLTFKLLFFNMNFQEKQ